MSDYDRAVDTHYGGLGLSTRILDRLRDAGKDLRHLSRDDLSGFDEFHTGGRPSTRELAWLAEIRAGMRILDVGSGIGGPARTLAAEFGCRVVGIDLTGEFCRAAHMLTALVHLSSQVAFQQGDALRLPYRDRAFDVVWSQNAIMNIGDKESLFREIWRVLRPNGIFALQAAFAGARGEIRYPTFWAPNATLNFLSTLDESRRMLTAAGLHEEVWENTTRETLERARKRRTTSQSPEDSGTLGRDVIVIADVVEKIENSVRNMEEHRVVTARSLWRRGN